MEITVHKQAGYTVLTLKGRLDAEGALLLNPYIDRITADDENNLIIDMSSVPYLSSGGIRALHGAYKIRKSNKGVVMLAGTGEFSRKVLVVSGFDRIFPQFTTVEQAVRSLPDRSFEGPVSTQWKILPGIPNSTATLRYLPVSDGAAGLISSGPWNDAHHSGLKTEDLLPLNIGENTYVIGIGAFGPSPGECSGVLGDMVVAGRLISWAPPGGGIADYILQGNSVQSEIHDSKSIREIPGIFTACSFVLEGEVHEVLLVETGRDPGKEITLGDMYAAICTHAKERDDHYTGVLAVKILADTNHYEAITVEKSPVEANRPINREPVWSKDNHNEWFRKSVADLKDGATLAGFGVIYDRSLETGLDREMLSLLFPGRLPEDGSPIFSHTLGVLFKHMDWDHDADIDRVIGTSEIEGEFTGMCRLTTATGYQESTYRGILY